MDAVNPGELIGLVGGLTALISLIYQALKVRRDAARDDRKQQAEERKLEADLGVSYREEVRTLRAERKGHLEAEQRCQVELAAARRDLSALSAELGQLKRSLPSLLVHSRLTPDEAGAIDHNTRWVLDKLICLVVVSSPAERGSILFVNAAWELALGRPREELLGTGWVRLMHPDDLAAAREAEALAWHEPIDGAVLRYRHADGRWIPIRWYVPPYRQGTIGVAFVEMSGDEVEEAP